MLRSPIESTISHAALLCQLKQVQIASKSDAQRLLKMCALEYIDFIRCVQRAPEGSIILFDEYIRKGDIIFDRLPGDKPYLSSIFQSDGAPADQPVHVMPSDEREKLKNIFKDVSVSSREIARVTEKAVDIYQEIVAKVESRDGY